MSNVTNLSAYRIGKNQNNGDWDTPGWETFQTPLGGRPVESSVPATTASLEELNRQSDVYLLGVLRIAQELERAHVDAERSLLAQTQQLETHAYQALLSGVPEEDIYNLCGSTGLALENAIKKVQERA